MDRKLKMDVNETLARTHVAEQLVAGTGVALVTIMYLFDQNNGMTFLLNTTYNNKKMHCKYNILCDG